MHQKFLKNIKVYYRQIVDLREEQKHNQRKKKFNFFMKPLKWIKNLLEHLTEEPSAPIVDEPTSEKIIMETTIEPVVQIRDWSIDRIHHLADTGNIEQQLNAVAIAEEFDEWINLPEGDNELDYLCLEREEGFGDQEIDVR